MLPVRHPEKDFFISDIFDNLPFKDDLASMEHPIFSLSKKRDLRDLEYKNGNITVTIKPNSDGLPTVFDKDVLLYCGSLLMEQVNKGVIPPKTLRISSHDLLVATSRLTNGEGYTLLKKALDRLNGVTIKTNIKTNGTEQIEGFGLIDTYRIVESSRVKDRMIKLEITLSDWFYRSIIGKEVLTISPLYFRLGKPLERRIYEIARKHCGKQNQWRISLTHLKEKTGSTSPLRKFRFFIREIEKTDELPDYRMEMKDDNVTFINRTKEIPSEDHDYPMLQPGTYDKAKRVAPGYDIYFLEDEWKGFWVSSGKPQLRSPDGAFIAFCKKRHEMNPLR